MTIVDKSAEPAAPAEWILRFIVSFAGIIIAADPADIEDHLDEVMAELQHLRAEDPAIHVDLAHGRVGLSVVVEAVNPLEAVNKASGLIRAAIHASDGATPDWPGPTAKAWGIRLLSVSTGEPLPG